MELKNKELWESVNCKLGNFKVELGEHWSWNFFNDPKRLGFVLSRYKFASKMACQRGKVLELGCSMGIGATILAEAMQSYTGVDLDASAIQTAKANLSEPKYSFIYDDFLDKTYGSFDAVVSLDVIEHIYLEYEELYFKTLLKNLSSTGICVVGTPNITAAPYASIPSQLGHVNLYSQTRLQQAMQRYFHQVFAFGMNDEIMHTGFESMAHYIICVGFYQK